MFKRFGAALAALLTFATALAVVPLVSAEPADAHTKTVRRCAYDPFAGRQCWNEKVPHVHLPNHYSPPPDTSPRTPPTTTAPPPPTTTEPPKCPAGQSGTPPNCVPDPCPSGTSGTPPHCVPDVCPTGKTGTPPNCVDIQTATHTVKPCTPYQAPTEVYQRHKHPLGSGTTDTDCHRHDNSHCPTGHTEQGAHGSQDCRKNDPVDTLFTRIGHALKQGGKAAFEAAVEALKDEVEDLDIDWDEFGTDPVETSKLLELLNPVIEQSGMVEIYTLHDLQTLWSDIGEEGRRAAATGGGGAACYIAVEAILVKATKGKSLKAANRHAVGAFLGGACGYGTSKVPVPDPDDGDGDDSSDDDGDDSSDDDSDGDDSSDDDSTARPDNTPTPDATPDTTPDATPDTTPDATPQESIASILQRLKQAALDKAEELYRRLMALFMCRMNNNCE